MHIAAKFGFNCPSKFTDDDVCKARKIPHVTLHVKLATNKKKGQKATFKTIVFIF